MFSLQHIEFGAHRLVAFGCSRGFLHLRWRVVCVCVYVELCAKVLVKVVGVEKQAQDKKMYHTFMTRDGQMIERVLRLGKEPGEVRLKE
jgi:hypothetical protein